MSILAITDEEYTDWLQDIRIGDEVYILNREMNRLFKHNVSAVNDVEIKVGSIGNFNKYNGFNDLYYQLQLIRIPE